MKKIRTSNKSRKCKHPKCAHILSIYNHEEFCHIHLSVDFEIPKLRQAN